MPLGLLTFASQFMGHCSLSAISSLNGRYRCKTRELSKHWRRVDFSRRQMPSGIACGIPKGERPRLGLKDLSPLYSSKRLHFLRSYSEQIPNPRAVFMHTRTSARIIIKSLEVRFSKSSRLIQERNRNLNPSFRGIRSKGRYIGGRMLFGALAHFVRRYSSLVVNSLHKFTDALRINKSAEQHVRLITPFNYSGMS